MKSCLFLLGFVLCFQLWAHSQDKTNPVAQRWFDVTGMDEEVFAPKKPLVLTPALAVQIFEVKSPHVAKNWRDKLQQSGLGVEELPGTKPGAHVIKLKAQSAAFAAVRKFSKQSIQVMILNPYGHYLWHRYYECLADFQIP